MADDILCVVPDYEGAVSSGPNGTVHRFVPMDELRRMLGILAATTFVSLLLAEGPHAGAGPILSDDEPLERRDR